MMRSRVALRERALLDVLDLAVRFCAAHPRAYMKMSFVVLGPALALSCVISWAAGWWFAWAATILMTAFAGAPFVALASRLVFADDASTRDALRIPLRSLPALAVVRAIQTLALALSIVLFGLPWLWTGTIFLFVVEVILLEQQSGIGAALRRAQLIAGARIGPVAGAMLLLAAIPIAAAMVGDVAGREVFQGLLEIKAPPSVFRAGGSWLALVGWWVTVPLTSTARFFIYLDIRTRTEGWDIQTRFAAIVARASSPVQRRAERTGSAPRAVLMAMALLVVPCEARAAMDPSHVRADVDAAMVQKGYSFCRNPREPLTFRARELCRHAAAIPGCDGLSAACARAGKMSSGRSARRDDGDLARTTLKVPEIVAAVARTAVWLLVAAIVAAVLVPIVRAIARGRRPFDVAGYPEAEQTEVDASIGGAPATTDEDALLLRADGLARLGDGAVALEIYLAAALRALDKRGAIHTSKNRTNGEYVRSCADESAKAMLETLVRDVDRVKFGGENASADVVSRVARRAVGIVRALPVALLALTLGCGRGSVGATPHLSGDDPAGDELLHEVLRRQGIHAERLDTALASLPLPALDERAPAVVVDADRTHIDLETSDHLAAWVDAGGVLVLAGSPDTWPHEFGATMSRPAAAHDLTAGRLILPDEADDRKGPTPQSSWLYENVVEHAKLASSAALTGPASAARVAWLDKETTYAARVAHGKGFVIEIATDELMTNVALARAPNAAAMIAILSNADRAELRFAQEDDGEAPPATPLAALSHAGLGVGLTHGLVATLILFLAVGVRLARAKPSPPPRCRAFAEHVVAVGALYAQARAAPHALTAYVRFVEERLRARLPREMPSQRQPRGAQGLGPTDVATFLATRASLPLDACRRLWIRATESRADTPLGDEFTVLVELSKAYAAATAEDRH